MKRSVQQAEQKKIAGHQDPRVDAYILKSAEFARPILNKLRDLVHRGCPQVQETIKWGMPSFEYKGPFCSMAAFKNHAVFGFWKTALLFEGKASLSADEKKMTWGAPGRDSIPTKITCIDDLPPDAKILALIRKAKKLNDDGVKVPRSKTSKKPLPMPKDFQAALAKLKGTRDNFNRLSPSCQREYIEWITEAKREATRQKRLTTALEWIAVGKSRNWKYDKKS